VPAASVQEIHHVIGGQPGSESSATIFGEFFTYPGGRPFDAKVMAMIGPGTAFYVEALATAILLLVNLCVTDESNGSRPGLLTASTTGLIITLLISLLTTLTMACCKPACDFSAMAGWGAAVPRGEQQRLVHGLHPGARRERPDRRDPLPPVLQ
jgi:glycerol uptake facilitator-like aquaporin